MLNSDAFVEGAVPKTNPIHFELKSIVVRSIGFRISATLNPPSQNSMIADAKSAEASDICTLFPQNPVKKVTVMKAATHRFSHEPPKDEALHFRFFRNLKLKPN